MTASLHRRGGALLGGVAGGAEGGGMLKLLDAFSGAGGAGYGYSLAGFDVTGIDNRPMPRYPFRHIVGDALEYIREHGHEYSAIAASPPCQQYSVTRTIHGRTYPDLVAATRDALNATGRPWVIENVVGAPLRQPVMLCGTMFGLRVYRHRLFESNVFLMAMSHPKHYSRPVAIGRRPQVGEFMTIAGHFSDVRYAGKCMAIDWMTRDELAQAIPPAFTRFIGLQLRQEIEYRASILGERAGNAEGEVVA